MRDRACFSFVLTPDPCSVSLATANDTAPRTTNGTAANSSINLSASTRRRPRNDRLLSLHDPYGPGVTLYEFGDLVRHSLAIRIESPTPSQNEEAGQVPPSKRSRSVRRTGGNWLKFILKLIRQVFSYLQMGLSSMYYRRVELIIRKSEISVTDLASIKQLSTNQGMLEMIKVATGVCMPEIKKIHSMKRFKKKWKSFVKRCIAEWGNLNVVTVLLLS